MYLFILLLRAIPVVHGGSQAKGQIRAMTASLHHSSQQHQILNPLIEGRDRTCNLMVPRWICFRCVTAGTPDLISYFCIP